MFLGDLQMPFGDGEKTGLKLKLLRACLVESLKLFGHFRSQGFEFLTRNKRSEIVQIIADVRIEGPDLSLHLLPVPLLDGIRSISPDIAIAEPNDAADLKLENMSI